MSQVTPGQQAAAAARIRRHLAPLVAAPLAQRTTAQIAQAMDHLAPDLAVLHHDRTH